MKIKILNKDNLINPNLSIGSRYTLSNLKEYETTDGEVYRKNFNETLDSGVIVLTNLTERINIEPYDEIILSDSYSGKNMSIFANKEYRMLVDNFTETMVSVEPKIYRYDINLFSKTKLLEGAICPNLSITPLRVGTKRSIYHYIQQYMNLYCTKKRVGTKGNYNIAPIISLSSKLASKFSDSCPELQWNTPTLREVLNDLFILKDCIPVVNANNELDYLDLTEIKNNITAYDGINYIQRSQSSQDYVSEIYMNMVNVMNTSVDNVRNTVNTSEYIPFNATNYVATSENVILKTRFPIQRIKHLYMVFVGMAVGGTPKDDADSNYPILQKVDLTNLEYNIQDIFDDIENPTIFSGNFIKEKNEYDTLKIAYRLSDMHDNLDEYQNCCLYYTRYSNEIRGFTNETKNAPFLFFDSGELDTIWILNKLSRYNAYKNSFLKGLDPLIIENGVPYDYYAQLSETDSDSKLIKPYYSIFFQVEYETIADFVFKVSKERQPSNSRVIVDNQPYSFVDSYSQGFLEYQKANRLGNQVMMINQRVNADLSNQNLIDIGDYYEDGNGDRFIVYNVEYQNNRHHIEVNAQATKDYVLKNYFTGVKQKIRTWVNAQDEAHIRNELIKTSIELSSKNKTVNDITNSGWTKFFDNKIILSGIVNNSQIPDSVIIKTHLSDGKYIPSVNRCFFTDSIFRVSGRSIVMTAGFNENYSAGKQIKTNMYKSDINFEIVGGGFASGKYPYLANINKDIGGIALENEKYTDDNGNFETVYINIAKEKSTPMNMPSYITNATISSVQDGIGYVQFDTNLYENQDTFFNYIISLINSGTNPIVYIENNSYLLRRQGQSGIIFYVSNISSTYSGKRVTVLPIKISPSATEMPKTDVYKKVNDFMKKCYNFPVVNESDYDIFAQIRYFLLKDNKDIYTQHIQLEYNTDTDNIYFTNELLKRNDLVNISKSSIKIYQADTYIKNSTSLPSGATQTGTLSFSDNKITINGVTSNKAYYITDSSGKVILGTTLKEFYVNVKTILNDNIYNENGIIVDTL